LIVGEYELGGDFDGDGDVDGTDFLVWQRGGSPDPLSASDLVDWRTNFGTVASSINAATTGVPEPTTWLLLTIGMAMILAGRRMTVLKLNCV
jgi:PEP-CTERM motif